MVTGRLTVAGERTRARIVTTAAELMFRQGVAGTSIPDVQAAAAVSASQIYHYFRDKDALVRAVIEHQIETSLDHQRPVLDHLDSVEALRSWCEAAIALQDARGCVGGCEIGSLASELAEGGSAGREDLVLAFARWEAPIRSGLARMQARGELPAAADVSALATAMLAAIQGGLLLSQLRRDSAALRAATGTVVDHIEALTRSCA